MSISTWTIIYIKIFQPRSRTSILFLIKLLIEKINKQYTTFLVRVYMKDRLFFITLFISSEIFCWKLAYTYEIIVDEDMEGEGGVFREICKYW